MLSGLLAFGIRYLSRSPCKQRKQVLQLISYQFRKPNATINQVSRQAYCKPCSKSFSILKSIKHQLSLIQYKSPNQRKANGETPEFNPGHGHFLIRERQYKFHIHTSENLCVWGKMEHVHFKNRFIDCNKFLYFTRARRKTRKQAHPLENPLNHPTNTLGQLSLPRAEVFIHIYIYIYI